MGRVRRERTKRARERKIGAGKRASAAWTWEEIGRLRGWSSFDSLSLSICYTTFLSILSSITTSNFHRHPGSLLFVTYLRFSYSFIVDNPRYILATFTLSFRIARPFPAARCPLPELATFPRPETSLVSHPAMPKHYNDHRFPKPLEHEIPDTTVW